MRIISGRFRGKKIEWVSDKTTRPTPDRVKENIFNVLASMGVNFETARVLDLFGGTGQMSLECASRGAKEIIINDNNAHARKVIEHNFAAVNAHAEIQMHDYAQCLRILANRDLLFNLVFLDPPFTDRIIIHWAVKFLTENRMLERDAVIVAETDDDYLEHQKFVGFTVDKRKYGRVIIYFLRREKN
jgi:16S rRNA (guanine(966)-N(2))-methyltransferase RsmD